MNTREEITKKRLRDNHKNKAKVPVQKQSRPVAPKKGEDLDEFALEDAWDGFSREQSYQQEHTERYARQQGEAQKKNKQQVESDDQKNTPADVDRMVKDGLLDADAVNVFMNAIKRREDDQKKTPATAAHFERMHACLARL